MGSELLRRVRWSNVGRACGVLLVVAAVVAWPRLNSSAPRLPDPAGRPLVKPPAQPRRPATHPPRERQRAPIDRDGRRRRVPRRHEIAEPARPDDVVVAPTVVPPPSAVVPPPSTVVPPPTVVPPAATRVPTPSAQPDPDPAQQEFGFEG